MRQVTVNYEFQGEVSADFPDKGVFYADRGLVLRCDPYGEVAIHHAKPIDGTDVVVVAEGADDLLNDNPDLFIELVMGGAAK
ncbi:hypothetical protein [Cytobacillus oceanisediminis]|uniref:hypothetical protein n=1 Tax=Cytobacillus oceanisediminis TaxID=665099 RepID=UPI002550852E|nr:hypothetical protein [Cytobacillus oceanisediminis]MDK7669296.1 hypothetical protein [Cytobacillus oceanisediminis]